jgi:predicted small integral membrane protein
VTLRIFKIIFAAAVGLNLLLTALDNAVFDYSANYAFVQHVLSMDTLFSGEHNTWRALRPPSPEAASTYWVYRLFYGSIIAWEAAAAGLCLFGATRLWRHRSASSITFQGAKSLVLIGLALSMLQWFLAFETVGGVWFQMWQSSTWNGLGAASRMFIYVSAIFFFIRSSDDELTAP